MKLKLTISELLFYSALIVFFIGAFFKQTLIVELLPFSSLICNTLIVLSMVVLFLKFMLDFKFNAYYLFVSILLGIAFVMITLITRNITLPISLILFMINIGNIDFKNVIKVALVTLISCMIIIQLFYMAGFLSGNDDFRVDGSIRYAIGYKFVTYASNFVFHILVMYMFIRQEKIKWIEILILFTISWLVYKATDTKAALLFSILAIGVMIVVKLFHQQLLKQYKLINCINKYSVGLSAITSILLTYFYSPNNVIFAKLNNLLTNRLQLGKFAMDYFPIRLFGEQTEWIFYGDTGKYIKGEWIDYLYVDASFLNILINYGIFTLLFVVISFYLLSKKQQFQTIYFAFALLLITLHSMFDPQFLELLYNPFILSIGYLFSPIAKKD